MHLVPDFQHRTRDTHTSNETGRIKASHNLSEKVATPRPSLATGYAMQAYHDQSVYACVENTNNVGWWWCSVTNHVQGLP